LIAIGRGAISVFDLYGVAAYFLEVESRSWPEIFAGQVVADPGLFSHARLVIKVWSIEMICADCDD
jgi:hypothetical protein